MATTILTPAENRFLQLSQQALALPALTRLMPLLRDHPTIKDSSDFLPRSARAALLEQRVDWLKLSSTAWKLLADSPYVINPSSQRLDWRHCALCHKPVRYEYHVALRANGHKIIVGSECVKKFMSDEMQYLMTITTEDNIHAVAQYDDLTEHYPQVPEILWDSVALPNLPAAHHRRQRWVHNGTEHTVTGYLKHRQTTLPEGQLRPYLSEYDTLTALDHKAAAAAKQAAQHRADQERQLAEEESQAAWDRAQHQESSAVQALRASAPYQTTLRQVANLMAERLPLATFKAQLADVTLPAQLRKLINSYQLGVMATEFTRSGQITAARLQIAPRYLVADLDRFSQRRAQQRQRDWNDDLFNAAVGFTLTPAQRQDWLTKLQRPWEGQQVPASVLTDCLTLRERLTAGQTVPTTWPKNLRQAFAQRLAQQPAIGWVPAKKNHVTTAQLRQLASNQSDFPAVAAAYHRLYALPEDEEAVTLSALQQAYLQMKDAQAQRTTDTQRLVQEILKN
ncbi:hypothetical protein [Levilactobacillus yiduensis]|uniref:hypothetical protein n=1 Tax=Levilactobacillus yiduensis TaxID=2953880 RepID=UPI000EF32FDC|nr:hypothetical protein [Levilactobacillus yiduensis]AYM01820.1 hypothetical protein D8911_01995 [Levilactobacillus brevis]